MNNDTAPFVPAPEFIEQVPPELVQSTHDLIIPKEQTEYRLSFCNTCEHNGHNEYNVPTCLQCECNISMLTTLSFKSCPINKWVV